MALICQAWSYTSPLRAARKFLPLGEHTTTMSFPSNDGLIRSIGLVFDLWHSPLALESGEQQHQEFSGNGGFRVKVIQMIIHTCTFCWGVNGAQIYNYSLTHRKWLRSVALLEIFNSLVK